jgi:phospholipase C
VVVSIEAETGRNRIEHLIILMMENRSFDHYLGSLSLAPENRQDVDGLTPSLATCKDVAGKPVPSWPMDGTPPTYPDPPHGWEAAHADYHDGANDGFVVQHQGQPSGGPPPDPRMPMGYYTRKTLPILYALADRFTICDHWFASVLSSTWPNRKYLHSGRRDEDRDTQNIPLTGFHTRPLYDALEDATDRSGARLTWKCYFTDIPFLAFWYGFAATHLENFTHVVDFVQDCAEDRLPTVSIVDPPFTLADDHPAHDPRLGEKFIGLVVDALTHSDSWAKSTLLILYDENGGFYDHAPLPMPKETPASEDQPLGFRVPALVVSPFAQQRYCCKTEFDHTSVMKSIHTRWGVEFGSDFGGRWPLANDIWADCFDFTAPGLERGCYTGDPREIFSLNWGSGIHEQLNRLPDTFLARLERILVLPELKALDRRAAVFDTLVRLEQRVIAVKRLAQQRP